MSWVVSWEDDSGRGCRMDWERGTSFHSGTVEKGSVLLEEEESWISKITLKFVVVHECQADVLASHLEWHVEKHVLL